MSEDEDTRPDWVTGAASKLKTAMANAANTQGFLLQNIPQEVYEQAVAAMAVHVTGQLAART